MRNVLEGVTPIGYQDCDCTFSGCVYSTLKYLGEEVSHSLISGLNGSAFKLHWHKDWCRSNGSYYGGHERLFGYFGLRFRDWGFVEDLRARAEWPDRIKGSIDAGYPVISAGIIGAPECIIITGYDGDQVIGLSYFYEYGKYFERANWLPDCYALLLVLGKGDGEKREQVRRSIEQGIRLARAPERQDGYAYSGLRAYDAWADALLDEANFAGASPESVAFKNLVNRNVTLSNLLSSRRAAAEYLRVVSAFIAAPRAISHYLREVEVLTRALELAPDNKDPLERQQTILDRAVREELARLVWSARDHDARAVAELERV